MTADFFNHGCTRINTDESRKPTIGSLFAGIGGFDIGFENAGFETRWQVELNPINRAVLADRFPHARQFEDVRTVQGHELGYVDCITAGFPCQDISTSGSSAGTPEGLKGKRSGLFSAVLRLLEEIRPAWVVLENVPALLFSNNCADIETVIQELAKRGYVGCFRVLDAQYFGVPQKRRRLFLVAGLGRGPGPEFLADCDTVESLPCTIGPLGEPRHADAWAANTLQADTIRTKHCLGAATFVAYENRWDKNVERERKTTSSGVLVGLDDTNFAQAFSAGNAVVPACAQWVAEKIIQAQMNSHPCESVSIRG